MVFVSQSVLVKVTEREKAPDVLEKASEKGRSYRVWIGHHVHLDC